jgi:hypothetical protein
MGMVGYFSKFPLCKRIYLIYGAVHNVQEKGIATDPQVLYVNTEFGRMLRTSENVNNFDC